MISVIEEFESVPAKYQELQSIHAFEKLEIVCGVVLLILVHCFRDESYQVSSVTIAMFLDGTNGVLKRINCH